MTTSGAGQPGRPARTGLVAVEELARRKGAKPKTVDDLACPDAFDTDEELDEFLAFVTEQRRANLA
jgi:hypothetical protein